MNTHTRSKDFEIAYIKKISIALLFSSVIHLIFRSILSDIIGVNYLPLTLKIRLAEYVYSRLIFTNISIWFIVFFYCVVLRSNDKNLKAIISLRYTIVLILFFFIGFYIFKNFTNFTINENLLKYIHSVKSHIDIINPNNDYIPLNQYNKAVFIINLSFFIYSIYYNLIFMIVPSMVNESFSENTNINRLEELRKSNCPCLKDEKIDCEENLYEEESSTRLDEMYSDELFVDNDKRKT